MDKAAERRKHFKTPPADSKRSQEARRTQALEEQKRKRSQQVDASRQLDQFSLLNLDDSDDEVDEGDVLPDKRSKSMDGVAQFAAMLQSSDTDRPPYSRSPSPFSEKKVGGNKPKSKRKNKGKGKKKPSKWANKCMYAELLEMREDTLWTKSFDIGRAPLHDGLPDDLETSWVGLAPIPVGKRCLAVTMQSAGVSGIVPNTILRSRLLGKVIIRPFPSPLPPNTILDCILDENWRANGILHVLDVVRWKSQNVAGCEANFRFWWRDTRLAEIPIWPPPPLHKSSLTNARSPSQDSQLHYRFPYPTTLAPVPYTAPLSFEMILGELLDKARRGKVMRLNLPVLSNASSSKRCFSVEEEMEMDLPSGQPVSNSLWTTDQIQEVEVSISSDGLLLYVGEAAYETGESPLSVWVPRVPFEDAIHGEAEMDGGSMIGHEKRSQTQVGMKESPLDTFERLVRRRLIAWKSGVRGTASSEVDNNSTVEVEMDA